MKLVNMKRGKTLLAVGRPLSFAIIALRILQEMVNETLVLLTRCWPPAMPTKLVLARVPIGRSGVSGRNPPAPPPASEFQLLPDGITGLNFLRATSPLPP